MKKTAIIISVIIILALFIGISLFSQSQQSSAPNKMNMHSKYDTPKIASAQQNLTIAEQLRPTPIEKFKKELIFGFESGSTADLSLPTDSIASGSALSKTHVKGYQVVSEDYYGNILHLLKLDDSSDLCTRLANENPRKGVYILNSTKLTTKNSSAYVWQLAPQTGDSIYQVNACFIEEKTKAWILDFYFPQKIYLKKYKSIIVTILDSFVYSK